MAFSERFTVLFFLLLFAISFSQKSQTEQHTVFQFEHLLQKMITQNNELVESKILVNQSQIQANSIARFNAPSLTGSIEKSMTDARQTSFPVYQTDLDVNTFNLGINGALPRYGFDYNLNYSPNKQNQQDFLLAPNILRSGKEISLLVNFNLLEDAGFKVGHILFDEKKLEYKFSQAEYNSREQDLIQQLIAAYVNVTVIQEKLESTAQIQQQARLIYDNYKALFSEGKISKVDLLSASIQLNQQKSNVLELNIAFREAKRALLELVGGFTSDDLNRSYTFAPLPTNWLMQDEKTVDGDARSKDKIYQANPDLISLESRQKLVNLRLESLKNKILPTLQLTAGFTRSENPIISIIDDSRNRFDRIAAGIRLTVPLNNIGARADLAAQKVEKSSIELLTQLLKKSIDLRSEGLSNEIKDIESRLKISKENERLSQKRFEASLPLVKVSASARIDIFTFQNQLIETQFDITDLEALLIVKNSELLNLRGELGKALKRSME